MNITLQNPPVEPVMVPKQEKGVASNISHSVNFKTIEDAQQWFITARTRLKDINQWHEIAGMKAGAEFNLVDERGYEVHRCAKIGDYFKINIPFPGLKAGKGYDWVRVKQIQDKPDPLGSNELFSITVSPAKPPADTAEVSHFLDSEASSTFMVTRNGLKVSAAILGRNETPNTAIKGFINKIRNFIVAIGAFSGFSHGQWKALVKGILSTH